MRTRVRLRLIRWVFVGSWLAAQMAGPVSVLALATGEHSVRPGDAAGILVLDHRAAAGEDHCHTALEVALGDLGDPEADDGEHRVRVPDADPARQPEGIDGLPEAAPVRAAAPTVERPAVTSVRVSRRAIGLSRPVRSLPLLL